MPREPAPAQQGTPIRLSAVESGMAALSVSVSFPSASHFYIYYQKCYNMLL